ncbi:MAG: glycoside hydrolase, partial [Hungatella hathewayi]
MNELFQKSLRESLYVHYPLKPEQDRSIEGKNLKKEVTSSIPLWDGESMDCWSFEGEGEVEIREKGVLHLHTWSRADHWPDTEVRAHDAAGGAYATFGSYIPKLDVSGLDLSVGNRIYFKIKPECEGNRSPIVRVGFTNNGVIKIPDAYSREGYNAMNLKNHEWNECVWEIDAIAHDKIEEISFNIH